MPQAMLDTMRIGHPLARRIDPYTRTPFVLGEQFVVCGGRCGRAYKLITCEHFGYRCPADGASLHVAEPRVATESRKPIRIVRMPHYVSQPTSTPDSLQSTPSTPPSQSSVAEEAFLVLSAVGSWLCRHGLPLCWWGLVTGLRSALRGGQLFAQWAALHLLPRVRAGAEQLFLILCHVCAWLQFSGVPLLRQRSNSGLRSVHTVAAGGHDRLGSIRSWWRAKRQRSRKPAGQAHRSEYTRRWWRRAVGVAVLGGVLALAAVSVGPADFLTPPNTIRRHLVELACDAVALLISSFTSSNASQEMPERVAALTASVVAPPSPIEEPAFQHQPPVTDSTTPPVDVSTATPIREAGEPSVIKPIKSSAKESLIGGSAAKLVTESDSWRGEERQSSESSASVVAKIPSSPLAVRRAVNPQVLEIPRPQALGRAVPRAAKPSGHKDPVQTHEQAVSDDGAQAARAVQRILQERQQHRVHVYFDGASIVLEGPVRTAADLTPSLRLAKRYGYPVVDRLSVWQRSAPLELPSPPVQPQNHERATQRQARMQNPDLLDMLFTPHLVDWDRLFKKSSP